MPIGWDAFLERAKQQATSEEPRALQAVWSEFLQRIQVSPRAEALQGLAKAVQKAPLDQRASVAIVVATLLAPLEWPPEWEQHRLQLVGALMGLIDTLNPEAPSTLSPLLESGTESSLLVSGAGVVLSHTNRLLATCRWDELRIISGLCDTGISQVVLVFRKELAKRAKRPLEGRILQARIRFDAAADRYVQAARALNSVAGEVLFKFLDLRLGAPET